MQNSLYFILERLLQKNSFSFDKQELELQLKSHPSYPSLHAITGVLDHFGFDNLALDVPQTKDVLKQLPKSFIAHLKNDNSDELVLVEKRHEKIKFTFTDGNNKMVSVDKFLNDWSGILVATEPGESQIDSKTNHLVDRVLFFSLILMSFYPVLIKRPVFRYGLLEIFFSILGVGVSYLLVKHEIGLKSVTTDKICGATKKTSCDVVLQSKGSKIFGFFKLSDLSFVYFTTIAVAWYFSYLFLSSQNSFLQIISLLGLPMVAYSIYYQAVQVKKWCPLCLFTAMILVLQALLTLFNTSFDFYLNSKDFFMVFAIAITVFFLYRTTKSIIKNNIELKKEQIASFKFKRNPSIFISLLIKSQMLDTNINKVSEIIFGNPQAKNEIILVTNPLCGFCKDKHQALENLLKNNSDEFKAVIRFNINIKDKMNTAYIISNILMNLYHKDKEKCKEAIHQIYTDDVDVKKWLSTYSVCNKVNYNEVLEAEKKWCLKNQINFTPAIYINGREFPKEYELTDLALFIEELENVTNILDNNNFNKKIQENSVRN